MRRRPRLPTRLARGKNDQMTASRHCDRRKYPPRQASRIIAQRIVLQIERKHVGIGNFNPVDTLVIIVKIRAIRRGQKLADQRRRFRFIHTNDQSSSRGARRVGGTQCVGGGHIRTHRDRARGGGQRSHLRRNRKRRPIINLPPQHRGPRTASLSRDREVARVRIKSPNDRHRRRPSLNLSNLRATAITTQILDPKVPAPKKHTRPLPSHNRVRRPPRHIRAIHPHIPRPVDLTRDIPTIRKNRHPIPTQPLRTAIRSTPQRNPIKNPHPPEINLIIKPARARRGIGMSECPSVAVRQTLHRIARHHLSTGNHRPAERKIPILRPDPTGNKQPQKQSQRKK